MHVPNEEELILFRGYLDAKYFAVIKIILCKKQQNSSAMDLTE